MKRTLSYSIHQRKIILPTLHPATAMDSNQKRDNNRRKHSTQSFQKETNEEKREVNAYAARRYRKRRKEQERSMVALYNENEVRIAQLERTVEQLKFQLRQ